MLIDYSSSDKKITYTMVLKTADNSASLHNGTRIQSFSPTTGENMETQLGKSVKIEVNPGLVLVLIRLMI